MDKLRLILLMVFAIICISVTGWGAEQVTSVVNNKYLTGHDYNVTEHSISINKNNYFIAGRYETGAFESPNILAFMTGKIDNAGRIILNKKSIIGKVQWGNYTTLALNKNNRFIQVNLGQGSNQIYYNAGKIDPETGKITFTDSFTFHNNTGRFMKITLNDDNQFVEVHEGKGSLMPWKNIKHLYYVIGNIDENGKIHKTGSGKYCGYGIDPNISLNENIFVEVHRGPDSSKPYAIYGSIDFENGKMNISKYSGQGVKISNDKIEDISSVHLKKIKIMDGDYYKVSVFEQLGNEIHEYKGNLTGTQSSNSWDLVDLSTKIYKINTKDNPTFTGSANDQYFIGVGVGQNYFDSTSSYLIIPMETQKVGAGESTEFL